MGNEKNAISRRDAMKQLGGAALGSALFSSAAAAKPALRPVAGAGAKTQARAAGQNGRPNILWITGEGVPTAALGCYGSTLIKTPNIDRIANEGMRFENSFTTNALCAPSRATLLTGTYTHINGMMTNPQETIDTEPPSHF